MSLGEKRRKPNADEEKQAKLDNVNYHYYCKCCKIKFETKYNRLDVGFTVCPNGCDNTHLIFLGNTATKAIELFTRYKVLGI